MLVWAELGVAEYFSTEASFAIFLGYALYGHVVVAELVSGSGDQDDIQVCAFFSFKQFVSVDFLYVDFDEYGFLHSIFWFSVYVYVKVVCGDNSIGGRTFVVLH